jgi:hypothetical protein
MLNWQEWRLQLCGVCCLPKGMLSPTCALTFVSASGNSSLADIQRQELAQKTKSAPLASAPPAVSPPAVVANVATANSFWDLADDEEEPMAKYVPIASGITGGPFIEHIFL